MLGSPVWKCSGVQLWGVAACAFRKRSVGAAGGGFAVAAPEPCASPSCVAFLSVRGCDTSVCSGHLSLTVRELPLPAVPPAPTAPALMGELSGKLGS